MVIENKKLLTLLLSFGLFAVNGVRFSRKYIVRRARTAPFDEYLDACEEILVLD